MLQRGHAPRPASSRRSSQSLPGESPSPASSIPALARRDDVQSQPLPELGGSSQAGTDERPMTNPPRSSGVRDILNPARQGEPRVGSSPFQPRAATEGERRAPPMASRPYGDGGSPSHPYSAHARPLPAPQHGPAPPAPYDMPPATTPGESTPIPGRESPGSGHGYSSSLNRRILTPRSPRVASLSRAAARSVDAQHQLPLPPPPHRVSVPPHDLSPLSGPPPMPGPSYPGHAPGSGVQPSPGAEAGPNRALSQPTIGPGRHSVLPQDSPQGNPSREQGVRPILYSPGPQYPPSAPPRAPAPSLGPGTPTGDTRWASMGSMPVGMPGARTIAIAEGQHVLTITPTHGEEIVVPVDMHQASKQADEKRQRNAGASARFRQRKKEREKEQQVGMQRLEAINREVEKRLRETEIERDFYRSERNRYRNLVAQTPGISEYAERAPPSPTRSSRSGGSFAAENSPLPGPQPTLHHPHHHPQPPHPPPYDTSMAERPTRRRRTDPEPQFTTPSYGPPPTTLPPIPPPPQQSYGMSPSPHPSPHPSTSSARLPPLRLDQPSPSPEYQLPPAGHPPPSLPPPPIPQSQQRHQSQYSAWSRPPQETGWATDPRGPLERGPR